MPVVTYVNTSAEVKAESDICCTSANAVEVVESLGVPRVIFLPDEYLGKWVASQTAVELILWKGHCEVHERFTGEELRGYREQHPGIHVLAHPECPPDVLEEADYVGSTSGMIRHLDDAGAGQRERKVVDAQPVAVAAAALEHLERVEAGLVDLGEDEGLLGAHSVPSCGARVVACGSAVGRLSSCLALS